MYPKAAEADAPLYVRGIGSSGHSTIDPVKNSLSGHKPAVAYC